MATVTGLTAERMLAIEGASVVDGDIVGDDLILTKHNGVQINAGNVRGPVGPTGPVGQDIAALASAPVLDVGHSGQIRAGRQLTAADFTGMGLSAPLGLWNLSDLSDSSGNGRALLNKGAVGLAPGINGLPNTAAQFLGSTTQALYIPDSGAADPFRIKTGTWGCWCRPSRKGPPQQTIMSKRPTGTPAGLFMDISVEGMVYIGITFDGSSWAALIQSKTSIFGRWHHVVGSFDGAMLRVYIDGEMDNEVPVVGTMFPAPGPLNIGAYGADSSVAGGDILCGLVDEAFITSDVLSADEIRMLYCARIPHTLGVTPSRISLNVQRRRRGGALTVADFSAQPIRLYNFSAGSLGDEGSNGVALLNSGGAPITSGADGTRENAYSFNGSSALVATDTGLPAALTSRSMGLWFRGRQNSGFGFMLGYGASPSTRVCAIHLANGYVQAGVGVDAATNGPFAADGVWHHAVQVIDNTASDGIKTKLYIDGQLTGWNTVLSSIPLANLQYGLRIGSDVDGGGPFLGQIDGVFITAYAMSALEVVRLYAKGSQNLGLSPKNAGDHIERMDATGLLATFDTLEFQHLVNLTVAP